jgi:hypothetical protein
MIFTSGDVSGKQVIFIGGPGIATVHMLFGVYW